MRTMSGIYTIVLEDGKASAIGMHDSITDVVCAIPSICPTKQMFDGGAPSCMEIQH